MSLSAGWRYFVCCLLFLGCGRHDAALQNSPDGGEIYFTDGQVYRMPYHDTFYALRDRLDDLGYNFSRVDSNTGVISTFSRSLRGRENRYCDCADVRSFHELGRKVRMTFLIEEINPGATRVTVRSRFTIYWSDGFRTVERTCASAGKLEKRILDFGR